LLAWMLFDVLYSVCETVDPPKEVIDGPELRDNAPRVYSYASCSRTILLRYYYDTITILLRYYYDTIVTPMDIASTTTHPEY
jgi:hypothetical protein